MNQKISRQAYAEMFGPTVGDRVRLADTELWIEVEKDYGQFRVQRHHVVQVVVRAAGGFPPDVIQHAGGLEAAIAGVFGEGEIP